MDVNRSPRLLSLDVFRGITIVLMILVNSAGNSSSYAWVQHSIWHGCTLADLVFPFFVFIVGVSVVYATPHSSDPIAKSLLKISKRTLLIFVIGLLLNAFPHHFDFVTLRYFGVLQRIAICYFFSAILCLTTSIRTQFFTLLGLVIGYWLIMTWPD